MEVSSNVRAIFWAASGRAKVCAAAVILARSAASPTMRCISATSRCGERLCCSITTAAWEGEYEKAFSVWSCDTSCGICMRIAGNPQLAISKMVPEPARATIMVEIPAAMRSANVLSNPNILYRSAYGEPLSTTEATLLTSVRLAVPAWCTTLNCDTSEGSASSTVSLMVCAPCEPPTINTVGTDTSSFRNSCPPSLAGLIISLRIGWQTSAMRSRTFSGNLDAAVGCAIAIQRANLADQSDTRPGDASAS